MMSSLVKTTIHVKNGRKDMGKAKDFKSFLKYLQSFGLLDRDKVPSEYYRAWKIVVLQTKEYGDVSLQDLQLDWEKRNG